MWLIAVERYFLERREDMKKIFKEGEELKEVKHAHREGFVEIKM